MKRLFLFTLSLAMCLLCTTNKVHAIEFKPSAMFIITGENFYNEKGDDIAFSVEQHMRLSLKTLVSETISLQVTMALPNEQLWGSFDTGTFDKENDAFSSHGDTLISLYESYAQFQMGIFDVKAGLQYYALPAYFGSANPIIDKWTGLTGIVVTTDVGILTPTLAWFIVDPDNNKASTAETKATKQNAFSLALATNINENMSVNPWVVFNDMQGLASQTFAGVTFDATISNLKFGIGGIYAMDASDKGVNMLASANASFDLPFGTPGIAFSYGIQNNTNIANGAGNGIGIGGSGIWGNFNGSGASAPGFMSGVQLGALTSYNPFDSLTAALTFTNIPLSQTLSLGFAGVFRMDTTDKDRESDYTIGARLQKIFSRNMLFIVDANGSMRDNYGPDFGGIISSVSGTLAIIF